MTVNQNGLLLHAGEGPSYSVAGVSYTFKAVGENTGEAYALFELVVPPQCGTPPHTHQWEDEAFYIQEGEVEFQLDEQTLIATAGTFLHSPKGQLHRLTNIGATPARMLCWVIPAGLEKFLAEVGQQLESPSSPPPPVTREDLEKILAAAPKYGLEIATQ
ncbi:cupin domain-containing protein [Kamptonema formosum]|uniref:cupin domain-containing protein n=1 Tax=Kamptonema formosum TaxID=331992 RepID=UPI000346E753|nr:cupin domain-containing protein [Oscillatoria sp. PCC 10802]